MRLSASTLYTTFTFLFYSLLLQVNAIPVVPKSRQQSSLSLMDGYAEFQISDGVGGTAQSEAWTVFLAPFHGIELESVSYDVYERLWKMWEEIDYANTVSFTEALQDAEGRGDRRSFEALRVGKAKNTVLLCTVRLQLLQIKLAKQRAFGQEESSWDTEDSLWETEDLLEDAILKDALNAGRVSLPVKLDFESPET